MAIRTNQAGRVFDLELSQSNQPSINDNWSKFGGQSSSQTKLQEYQDMERARQRGQKPVAPKAVKTKKAK